MDTIFGVYVVEVFKACLELAAIYAIVEWELPDSKFDHEGTRSSETLEHLGVAVLSRLMLVLLLVVLRDMFEEFISPFLRGL